MAFNHVLLRPSIISRGGMRSGSCNPVRFFLVLSAHSALLITALKWTRRHEHFREIPKNRSHFVHQAAPSDHVPTHDAKSAVNVTEVKPAVNFTRTPKHRLTPIAMHKWKERSTPKRMEMETMMEIGSGGLITAQEKHLSELRPTAKFALAIGTSGELNDQSLVELLQIVSTTGPAVETTAFGGGAVGTTASVTNAAPMAATPTTAAPAGVKAPATVTDAPAVETAGPSQAPPLSQRSGSILFRVLIAVAILIFLIALICTGLSIVHERQRQQRRLAVPIQDVDPSLESPGAAERFGNYSYRERRLGNHMARASQRNMTSPKMRHTQSEK